MAHDSAAVGDRVQRDAILVVEADEEERERLGSWLEEAGYDVALCPGPSGPDYTCVGSRGGICPLVEDADVVVLDMSLESEAFMQGTAADELLDLYLDTGRHVVALGSHAGPDPFAEEVVVKLGRHPSREELVDLVRVLTAGSRPRAPRASPERPI